MADSDRNEEFVIEDLLPIAIAYCDSEPFQSAIDAFTSKYAECFATAAEGKSNEVMEISHEHHALFTQYQELVDDLFVGLADKNGFTLKALYRCFRDAVDGKFTALFEEHEHKWFVDKVLSWMDLSEFLRMMRAASASRRESSKMSRK